MLHLFGATSLANLPDRRMEPARRTLHQAIALEPSLQNATPDQAIAAWEQGVSLTEDTIDALWDLALISLAAGDYLNGLAPLRGAHSTKNFVPRKCPPLVPACVAWPMPSDR